MSNIPFENHTISDINELYGRNGILKNLLHSVDERHDCINVVGCRRFGKTCLLETLVASIKNKENAHSYPFYIDSKSWNIGFSEHGTIGTFNVYRYLLAILLEEFTNKGFLKEDILIRDLIISPVYNRHAFYEKIKQYNSCSIADTFSDTIRKFSIILKKTIVFIFDEYEFLMTKAFSESTGFQTLRKLSSETYEGIRPFSYVVAGAVTWEHLCSSIGSKELNTIGSHIHYVKPLKYDDFKIFWNHECEKIDKDDLKSKIINQVDMVFERCGGVPFHANDIGSYLISNEGEFVEDYYAIIDEVFESLTENQRKLLVDIEQSQNNVNKGKDLIILRQLGLVKQDEMKLTIGLLKDYIQNELPIPNAESSTNKNLNSCDETFDLECVINEISSLRKRINHDWTTRQLWISQRTDGKNYTPFRPSIEDRDNFIILGKICYDRNDYNAFSGALYAIYYEGSSKGFNLPLDFSPRIRYDRADSTVSLFAQLVMANRHVYGGHVDYQPTEIPLSAEDVYNCINEGNEPLSKEDFKHAQQKMLTLCRDELKRMFEYLQNIS
jgi:hypothetical protein